MVFWRLLSKVLAAGSPDCSARSVSKRKRLPRRFGLGFPFFARGPFQTHYPGGIVAGRGQLVIGVGG